MLGNNGRFWLTITQAEGGFMVEEDGREQRRVVLPDTPGGRAKVRRMAKEWAEGVTAPSEPAIGARQPGDNAYDPAAGGEG